jgi:hypothetical protein
LVALTETCKDIEYVLNLTDGLTKVDTANVFIDNTAALNISKDKGRLSRRTRHVALKYFYCQDLVEDGRVTTEYVESENNLADVMTKSLPERQFEFLRDQLVKDVKRKKSSGKMKPGIQDLDELGELRKKRRRVTVPNS